MPMTGAEFVMRLGGSARALRMVLLTLALGVPSLHACGSDGMFSVATRSYADDIDFYDRGMAHAWIQATQIDYGHQWLGSVQTGLDLAMFAAAKLDGGDGAGNMAFIDRHDNSEHRVFRAYAGRAQINASLAGASVRIGIGDGIANPFLEAKDNRALPPSFRGMFLSGNGDDGVALEAGCVNATIARGTGGLSALSTLYGGTKIDRLDFAGVKWSPREGASVSVYAARFLPAWRRFYVSGTYATHNDSPWSWTANADAYVTQSAGGSDPAYSLSIAAGRKGSSVTLAYQRIAGDRFFDYLRETSGMYLANSMGADYNAPHERSLQLRYTIGPELLGHPGARFMVWSVTGRSSEATLEANAHATEADPLHALYWKAGRPVHGSHGEVGASFEYAVRSGVMQGAHLSLIAVRHNVSTYYPESRFREVRMTIDFPVFTF